MISRRPSSTRVGVRLASRSAVWLTLITGLASAPQVFAAPACAIPAIPVAPSEPAEPSAVRGNQVSLQNNVATARGDARLTDKAQALEAPYMRYNTDTTQASARGGLDYVKPGMFLSAKRGSVNVDKRTGQFDKTQYVMTESGVRGRAAKVRAKQAKHYRLEQATYTTCKLESPTWYLSATHVNLNRESGRGEAFNAVMHLYHLPIFYTPYFNFPIDDRRHTGFLSPLFGQSGRSGFELTAPFYINLAPQYDATLYPRYYTKRGFQLGGQARYRFRHYKGELTGQFMPNDKIYGGQRSFVHYQHENKFNDYVGFEADYNRASDDDYFDDFSHGPSGTSSSQLERAAQLSFAATGARFDLLVQDFQTLNPTDNGPSFYNVLNHDPYTRLPRARLELLSPTAPFRVGLNTEFTNFISPNDNGLDAYRWDAKPRLIWSIDRRGWFASSQAAYRYTHYDLSNLGTTADSTGRKSSIDRGIPSFDWESGLRFSRQLDNGWIQTLEPRFKYLYVQDENQSNIPIFDSGIPDLQYSRLFANNRFTGIDRIGDANQLTLGASSRLFSPESGRTLATFALGRVTSFRDLNVTLPNTGLTGYSDKGSDYVGEVTVSPIHQLETSAVLAYSADKARIDRGVAELRYATDAGYGLNLGYRFYRDYRPARSSGFTSNERVRLIPNEYETLEQVAIGAYAPVTDSLKLVGRWNYSLEINRNIESLVGVEYGATCCLAARVSWRRYVNNRRDNHDHEVLFQIIFRGLGSFGQSAESFVNDDLFEGITPSRDDDSFNTLRTQ